MKVSIFKAYDVRGIYPDEIDEDAAYKVGRALVRFLKAKTIVVGRDMRLSSPALKKRMIEGITAEGGDVVDVDLCTTPMLSFAVANYEYDGGVMVSASHNPGNYNAFKLIRSGALQIDSESGLKEIQKLVAKMDCEDSGPTGTVTEKEILGDYLAHVMKAAEGIEHLKVVVDYGNGVGAISAKPAFARLDLDVTSLYEEPDGNFPNHPANPHDTVNFKDIIQVVLNQKADLGIFFDGDADRAGFIDDLGRTVPVDLLFVLLSREELKQEANKGKNFYFDLRFSKSVPDQIRTEGGNPVMERVGNPVYKRALAEKGGILAAEFSGHIMYKENFGIDDGLYATLKSLALISKEGKKLSELIDSVKKYETSEEISLEAKNPETVLQRVKEAFPEGKPVELDGTYLEFPDGFVSVRQSQTEPQLFRIRVEAESIDKMQERFEGVKKIVTSSDS